MAVRANRRRSGLQQGGGSPFTVVAYLSAVLAALMICGAIGPGRMWRRSGLRKEYRSYLVLELPIPREGILQGALSREGEEFPPPHQKLMKNRRLSLPEYTGWLRGYSWEGNHLKASQDGRKYQIYYIPAREGITRIPIPVGYEYALSGDGENGFIVTIWEETS